MKKYDFTKEYIIRGYQVYKRGKPITTKSQARDFAIDWQRWQSEQSMSWSEVAAWGNFFEKLGKKFKLTEEFLENGII